MTMPLTFRLLKLLPIKKLQVFLEAGDGFYEVRVLAFHPRL
jgi:hypothetical protein